MRQHAPCRGRHRGVTPWARARQSGRITRARRIEGRKGSRKAVVRQQLPSCCARARRASIRGSCCSHVRKTLSHPQRRARTHTHTHTYTYTKTHTQQAAARGLGASPGTRRRAQVASRWRDADVVATSGGVVATSGPCPDALGLRKKNQIPSALLDPLPGVRRGEGSRNPVSLK